MSVDGTRTPDSPARTCGMLLKSYGPYGPTWPCGERRWHVCRHRHRNYTWPRLPQVWRLVKLWRTWRTNQRLRGMGAKPGDGLLRYQPVVFPPRFAPLPTAELSRRLAAEAKEARRG